MEITARKTANGLGELNNLTIVARTERLNIEDAHKTFLNGLMSLVCQRPLYGADFHGVLSLRKQSHENRQKTRVVPYQAGQPDDSLRALFCEYMKTPPKTLHKPPQAKDTLCDKAGRSVAHRGILAVEGGSPLPIRLPIKALSVNAAYRGRRFATPALTQYKRDIGLLLPKITIPDGKLFVSYVFGFSSKGSDIDNCVKATTDAIAEHFLFNDNRIYELHIRKVDVPKGAEFVEFSISSYPQKCD